MDLVDSAELQAGLVPLDFADDYQQSHRLKDIRLELPDRNAVRQSLQAKLAVSDDLIDQAMTALATGRHLIFYGPPGTGKTTLAEDLTTAFRCLPMAVTASADWTAFETAGGLQLAFEDGQEALVHKPGIITSAVVECLNLVSSEVAGEAPEHQAVWLIIDEINRANMDAAFGPYFNALDAEHPRVALPFMDAERQELFVPSRFRVIGTMNTYDKNFLFRMSYALTRRFALIEVGVPDNGDVVGRQAEGLGIVAAASVALARVGVAKTIDDLLSEYDQVLGLLYDRLITKVRDSGSEGSLGRGIGFAQIAAAFKQTAIAFELGYGDGTTDDDRIAALDRGVLSSVVPQLEGLPNSKLKSFANWWANEPELKKLTASLGAARALISGLDLFIADQE